MNFTSDFFVQNRRNFFKEMKKNSVLVLLSNDQYPKNGDQTFPFRQQSDLFYFTGIKQEETTLLMFKDETGKDFEFLFILKPNLKLETWEGKKLTQKESSDISGIKTIFWKERFDKKFKDVLTANTIFYLLGADAFMQTTSLSLRHLVFEKSIKKKYSNHKIKSARRIIDKLRLIKSEEEVAMMQKAVDITNLAFKRVLETVKPHQKEYEVEAEISYVFRKNGASGHAYEPIVATGINACSLHYVQNESVLKENELILMDFGADYNYYAADLSRTIPVNGQFTERQKILYQLVLDIQKKAIQLFVPGNTIKKINQKVDKWMSESLIRIGLLTKKEDLRKYYPHGVTHFLGIDVHDVGAKDVLFREGMVLTCEPGLYIQEEGVGIRIENDIVVGNPPLDLMANTIREINEIEKAMKS